MLFARIVRPARPFSNVVSLPELKLQGATLVRDGSFVGVLAEREELAIAAAAKLRAKALWKETPVPEDFHGWLRQNVTSRTILKRSREVLHRGKASGPPIRSRSSRTPRSGPPARSPG